MFIIAYSTRFCIQKTDFNMQGNMTRPVGQYYVWEREVSAPESGREEGRYNYYVY